LGRAYEALSENPAALDKLEQFQRQAPPELRARVPGLAERIASVRAHVATVTITSNVPGARVILGNKVIGTTPFSSPIATNAGRTVLEVSAEGYHTLHRDVDLKGGESITVDAPLTSKSTSGVLIIRSPNVGASVALDGTSVGTVPVELVVKAGTHAMSLAKEGYEQARTSAVIAAGERKAVDVPLEAVKPITAKWWFWTGVGVIVVAGAVTTYALLTERHASSGTIEPGTVSAPLVRF